MLADLRGSLYAPSRHLYENPGCTREVHHQKSHVPQRMSFAMRFMTAKSLIASCAIGGTVSLVLILPPAPLEARDAERELAGHRLCLPSGKARFGQNGRYVLITGLGKRVVGSWTASGSRVSVIYQNGAASNFSISVDGQKVGVVYERGGVESGSFCD
ncbi:MAG: hypothetical protein JOZ16_02775 [Methylobacteriaceae bacterium]|nr:hypothetical protein [Methylobacteriaceae bacterium]